MFIHPLQLLLEWKGFRRLYIYAMTENMKYDDNNDDGDGDDNGDDNDDEDDYVRSWPTVGFNISLDAYISITIIRVYNYT